MTVGHISCCRFSLISIARASCSCRTAFLGLPFACRMRAHWRCCAGVIKNLGPSFNAPALPSKAHSCDSHHIANAMAELHYPPSNGPQIAGNSPPTRSMEQASQTQPRFGGAVSREIVCSCSLGAAVFRLFGDTDINIAAGCAIRVETGEKADPGICFRSNDTGVLLFLQPLLLSECRRR